MMAPQVCFINDIRSEHTGEGRSRSFVSINKDAKPQYLDRPSEVKSYPGYIWLGGGGAYLLNQRYMVFILRDAAAPSNPNRLTVATGLSDGPREWVNPNLLLRELFEEVLLIKDGKFLLVPKVKGLEELAVESIKNVVNPNNDYVIKFIEGFIYEKNLDELVVNEKSFFGALCVHDETKTVNFMKLINLNFDSLENLEFVDTEKDQNNHWLSRKIFLYDLKKRELLNQNFEKVSESYTYTPQSKYLLEKLLETKND